MTFGRSRDQGTLRQGLGGARDTTSDGSLSLGLQILQQHTVRLDNKQLIASELRKLQSPHGTRTYPHRSFPFSSQRRTTQRITHLGSTSRFSEVEDENAEQSQLCQDLFFNLQTEGKFNWSLTQMKRLWADK